MAEKSEKMTKEQLRAPDTLQRVGVEAQSWLLERLRLVGGVLLVALVGGGAAAVASYFSKRGEERAAQELGSALQVLKRPVVEAAQPVPPGDGEEPPFKSEKEKDEALKKALVDFRAQHGGTRSAVTAALALGQAEYRLGNHEAALALLGEYLGKASAEEPLRAEALEGRGYVYEAQGKHEEALAAFEQMARETKGEHLQGMGQYHQARMLVLLGRKEEAAKLLADLKSSKAETAAGRLATERLSLLEAQGVKVPEPTPAAPSQDAG